MSYRSIRLLLASVLCLSSPVHALIIENGDLVEEIERLRDLTFTSGSGLYVAPDAGELTAFSTLATTLYSGDIAGADTQAAALDYELVQYTDNVSGDLFYGLREELVNNAQTRGWGSYFLRVNADWNVMLEVNHPRFDTNSWDIAGQAFQDSEASAFLMAGAHRNANGLGTADVAHLALSIFDEVHEAWASQGNAAWSIHGFDDANHNFPAGTDMVISHGSGNITAAMLALDAQAEASGFVSYGYNTENANSADNITLNGGVDGTTFSSLGGTTNQQGQYNRANGQDFLHIEYEQSIRFNSSNRATAAGDLVTAMNESFSTSIPGPPPLLLLLGGLFLLRRKRSGDHQADRGLKPLPRP